MKTGTQIVYVPTHANGDENHVDCEAGFVTEMKNGYAFCRYWSKHYPGKLRTTANSELTDVTQLVERDTTAQHIVNALIVELYELGGELVR